MKKSNENVLVQLTQAQCKVVEYLKNDHSYAELMEDAASAQAQIFNILRYADPDHVEECLVDEISQFFYYAINAFKLLQPYDELKHQL